MSEERARVLFAVAFGLAAAGKLFFAVSAELFAEEAYYWQCGQRLTYHFADLPFMTAALVRLSTSVGGDSPIGVRLGFLLLGFVFPFVIRAAARPLVGDRDAWLAGGASLALPPTAHLGMVAIPDVLILFFTATTFLGVERATRRDETASWLFVGASMALGLATHYRFVLVPLSVFLYLCLTENGRGRFRSRGPWIAAAGVGLGLTPTILYNLQTSFEPLGFYLLGRHGGASVEPLLSHVLYQVLVATPFLYAVLILVLIALVKRAGARDDRARLALVFALPPLLLFFLASPFHDTELMTVHWPAPGFLPLLLYLPPTARSLVSAFGRGARALLWILAPGAGALVVALACLGPNLGPKLYPAFLWGVTGWREMAGAARRELEALGDPRGILVADNYKVGAQLEFALGSEARIYVLDHPVNAAHGRSRAPRTWKMDEGSLREQRGENAVLVLQWEDNPPWARRSWMDHVQSLFSRLEPGVEVRAGAGKRKSFLFFRGRVGRAETARSP